MLNFVENDTLLFNLLEDIGHQVEGYNYTKDCNDSKWELGKLTRVLEGRKERLNKDINILVQHILQTYK